MGHSQIDKDESHERIVRTAAARFRELGVDGVGVAELMKESGLTHGGFYRHFGSRTDLVGEAVERALHDGGQAVSAILTNLRRGALGKLIDAYLSKRHRDQLATSCAVATLASDVARAGGRTRSAYTWQVETYLALLTRAVSARNHRSRRAGAILILSALVGAVSIARAVDDAKLSEEILAAVANELKAWR